VDRWHSEARKSYLREPPANWQTNRYAPDHKLAALQEDQIVRTVNRDALGIPIYTGEERKVLFKRFAPIWEIQYQGDNDRIGSLRWNLNGELDVDTGKPLTYTQLSFTRFGDDILTQLNYIIWFPARPKEGPLDIYGGFLDGIIFRVTLNSEGIPLFYDTIHNCGCYYKAFPTNQLQVKEASGYEEPPLIFKAPEIDPLKERMVISIDSHTHYIQHLYSSSRTEAPASTVYGLVDYGQLRSLPYSEGNRRSMFTQDSLAPGSQRLERYILWPTGVLSPGAMRQYGRHAVSFVGKRHFDEPFYMDRVFFKEDSQQNLINSARPRQLGLLE
jgi:hypothetical protein